MFVVLDSSVIISDFTLRSHAFRVFLESLAVIPARLCVPEIVLDEVLNKYREQTEQKLKEAGKSVREANRLLLDPVEDPSKGVDLEEVCARYDEHLRRKLAGAGATVLPYSDVPHKDVVRHALSRSKPFGDSDAGYRDYLIWTALRAEMYNSPDEIAVLVTGNTRDFCDEIDGQYQLAAVLEDDARRHHQPSAAVRVSTSVSAFVEEYVKPRLETRSTVAGALAAGGGAQFDLHAWAVEHMLELLRDEDGVIIATHGLDPETMIGYVTAVDTVDSVTVDEIRLLPEGESLIAIHAEVRAVLSMEVDSSHLSALKRAGESFSTYEAGSWTEPAQLTVGFSLLVDPEDPSGAEGELDSVAGAESVIFYDMPPSWYEKTQG